MDADHARSDTSGSPVFSEGRASIDAAAFENSDPYFTSDNFRINCMKITRCPRARPHDWTCCPYAHPGEKARRRDPRKFNYSGIACNEYRKTGSCIRGDACCFSHGVFECWLHPSRYRTQLCTDGSGCRRRVCFFAHHESELRSPEDSPAPAQAAPQPAAPLPEDMVAQKQAALAKALQELLSAQAQAQQVQTHPGLAPPPGLLDPLAHLQRLHTMQPQHHQQEDPAVAALFGGSGPGTPTAYSGPTMPQLDAGAGLDPNLIIALQALATSGAPAGPAIDPAGRHSLDAGPRPRAAMHYPPAPYPPGMGRRSVDNGSLAHAYHGAAYLGSFIPGPAPQQHPYAVPLPGAEGMVGSLSSGSYLEHAAGEGRGMRRFEPQDGLLQQGGSSAAQLLAAGPGSAGSVQGAVYPLDRRAGPSLVSIDEYGPAAEDDDSCAGSGSLAKSESRSSSFDGPTNGPAVAEGKDAYAGSLAFHRVLSFDNILAELPRSASQVNMVGLGM